MEQKRGRKRSKPADSGCRDRIDQLLLLLFQGNQVKAARALGISQPHISKVLSGARAPTESFMETLARQPEVNRHWLFHGEGEPLLPSTVGTLPVSRAILPGAPQDHADLCCGERHPVAAALDRPTRYWLELESDSALVQRLAPLFLAGDRLLIETARDHLDRADVVGGRLCAVTARSKTQVSYEIAQVLSKGDEWMVKPFDGFLASDFAAKDQPTAGTVFGGLGKRSTRKLNINIKKQASTEKPAWRRLEGPNEVVGLALKLERTSLIPEYLGS